MCHTRHLKQLSTCGGSGGGSGVGGVGVFIWLVANWTHISQFVVVSMCRPHNAAVLRYMVDRLKIDCMKCGGGYKKCVTVRRKGVRSGRIIWEGS